MKKRLSPFPFQDESSYWNSLAGEGEGIKGKNRRGGENVGATPQPPGVMRQVLVRRVAHPPGPWGGGNRPGRVGKDRDAIDVG